MYKVDNAIILAAGTASRFAPLSYERPKALMEVRGEILLERQIRQLRQAGIEDIYIVVGYKKERFAYLADKYNVTLIDNDAYLYRNNHSSIYSAREVLGNSYLCSSDNYFAQNPFRAGEEEAYYAAVYSPGETGEWCLTTDSDGYITDVQIGGRGCWYMLGHTFWTKDFSRDFIRLLTRIYDLPETRDLLWEGIYMRHLDLLRMKIKKYPANYIFEFDTLDELRAFDPTYVNNTRSQILRKIAGKLSVSEASIQNIRAEKKDDNSAAGFSFDIAGACYHYEYNSGILRKAGD